MHLRLNASSVASASPRCTWSSHTRARCTSSMPPSNSCLMRHIMLWVVSRHAGSAENHSPKWAHLKRHVSLNRCAGLRLKSTTTEPVATAHVGAITREHCPEVDRVVQVSETPCHAEQPPASSAAEHVATRVLSAVAPVRNLVPTTPEAETSPYHC